MSGPGLSCYVIGFRYEGMHYHWSRLDNCFKNSYPFEDLKTRTFKNLPIGAYAIEVSSTYHGGFTHE